MTSILLLLTILVGGYLVTHFLMARMKRWYLVATGLEYVLLGLLAGYAPQITDLLSSVLGIFGIGPLSNDFDIKDDVLTSLSPAMTIGIGSIGLLAGLRLNVRHRDRTGVTKMEHVNSSILISGATAVLIGVPALWLLSVYTHTAWRPEEIAPLMPLVLLVVSTAMVSATTPIQYTVEHYRARGVVGRYLVHLAEFTEVFAILLFGLIFAIGHPPQILRSAEITAFEWVGIELGLGAVFGLLFSLFIGDKDDEDKLLLAVLGITVFSSGIAYYLSLSPLLITFFVGFVLINFSKHGPRLLVLLEQTERPFYVVICFFTGVAWVLPEWSWQALLWIVLLVAAYIGLRWFAKRVGSWAASRANPQSKPLKHNMGSALIAQGGLSVAMVLSYLQVYQDSHYLGSTIYNGAYSLINNGLELGQHGIVVRDNDLASIITTVILVAVLINETIAVRFTRNLLINAGEIDPAVTILPDDVYAHKHDPDEELGGPEEPSESAEMLPEPPDPLPKKTS